MCLNVKMITKWKFENKLQLFIRNFCSKYTFEYTIWPIRNTFTCKFHFWLFFSNFGQRCCSFVTAFSLIIPKFQMEFFLLRAAWPKNFQRIEYRISFNKHQVSNKCCPLISAAPLGIHIEISAFLSACLLISAAPLNVVLIRIVNYMLLEAKPECI